MTIPHVIEWHEGAPEKLEAGMLVDFKDDGIHLIGTKHDGFIPGDPEAINRWAVAIKPHELTWASSMAQRQLAK